MRIGVGKPPAARSAAPTTCCRGCRRSERERVRRRRAGGRRRRRADRHRQRRCGDAALQRAGCRRVTPSAGWPSRSTVASPASACERCVTRDPRLVGVDLTGAVLREADAHGKHLLIRFDDGRTLHAHLRMDGSLRVGPAATEPEWRRRVELWMEDGRLTGLDVPVLGVVPTADEERIVGHLGPDLCGPEQPDLDEVARAAHRGGRRAAGRRAARPAQRRRVRQRLRRRAAVRRRGVAEPAGRHDRRPRRPARRSAPR